MEIQLRDRLFSLADERYRDFTAALIPNIEKQRVIGVRLPVLRRLAREVLEGDWRGYLRAPAGDMLEERLLRAFVVGGARVGFEEHLRLVADFIPLIDCWSVCDSFVGTLKFFRKNRPAVWDFIAPFFFCAKPYEQRFAIVTTLVYFADGEYTSRAFDIFERIDSEDYYVQTAIAWAVSVFFVSDRERTLAYLNENALDDRTHNRALQKIRDSRRVSAGDKTLVGSLKRARPHQ